MPKYVIAREISNTGKLSQAELQSISQCAAQSWSANSIGGELRHQRQNLLLLHRA